MAPDSIEVPYNMASVYQAQGRYDEGIQVMQDLLKKTEKADSNYTQAEKNNRSVFLERLGTIYRDNNNNPQAIETFRKMLALGDEDAERGYQQVNRHLPRSQAVAAGPPIRPKKQCRSCRMIARSRWCTRRNWLTWVRPMLDCSRSNLC